MGAEIALSGNFSTACHKRFPEPATAGPAPRLESATQGPRRAELPARLNHTLRRLGPLGFWTLRTRVFLGKSAVLFWTKATRWWWWWGGGGIFCGVLRATLPRVTALFPCSIKVSCSKSFCDTIRNGMVEWYSYAAPSKFCREDFGR